MEHNIPWMTILNWHNSTPYFSAKDCVNLFETSSNFLGMLTGDIVIVSDKTLIEVAQKAERYYRGNRLTPRIIFTNIHNDHNDRKCGAHGCEGFVTRNASKHGATHCKRHRRLPCGYKYSDGSICKEEIWRPSYYEVHKNSNYHYHCYICERVLCEMCMQCFHCDPCCP